MTLKGVLSSPSQRRVFLLASGLIILISWIGIGAMTTWAPDTRGWDALNSMLISVVAAGVFALVSGLYISYFFVDPTEEAAKTILLPEDIEQVLRDLATRATDYKIYVRTGRHFRADILPLLVKHAKRLRRPINIKVVLLDFRDHDISNKYANFRKTSSFDRRIWSTNYVQQEVMATILKLIQASSENCIFISVDLFLSKRLSNFRIEGSSDEIVVTREDPKDTASRYLRDHRDFSAFVAEFGWICDEACRVEMNGGDASVATLVDMFGELPEIASLGKTAVDAMNEPSPYVR